MNSHPGQAVCFQIPVESRLPCKPTRSGGSPQSTEASFVHGMSDGAHGQDPMEAQQKGDDFIAQNEHDAKQAQAEWIASGHTGISPKALTAFGNALHTITDRTSPTHTGNQPWYGSLDPRALAHVWGERSITPDQKDTAINAARNAFYQTFGNQFDWMILGMHRDLACVTTYDSATRTSSSHCD